MRSGIKTLGKGNPTDNAIKKVIEGFIKEHIYGPGTIQEESEHEDAGGENMVVKMLNNQEREEHMLVSELATCLPMVKIEDGKYLLGCDLRRI